MQQFSVTGSADLKLETASEVQPLCDFHDEFGENCS
jgi:hypothetical protein